MKHYLKISLSSLCGIFLLCFFVPIALAATSCSEAHIGYGKCAADCTTLGSDYLVDSATNLCSTSTDFCCYKTAGEAATLQLQVPIFDVANINSLPQYIATLYRYLIILLVPLTILVIIIAGITWVTAGGNTSKIDSAKKYMISAFSGLIIGLFSYVILNLVGINALVMPGIEIIPAAANPNDEAIQNQMAYGPPVAGGNTGKTTKQVCENIINKPELVSAYKSASAATGVEWEILAAIHYREYQNSTSSPSNGYGPMQIMSAGYTGSDCHTWPGCLTCAGNGIKKFKLSDPARIFCRYNGSRDCPTSEYAYNDPDNRRIYMIKQQGVAQRPDTRPGALIIYNALKRNCQ